MKEAFNEAAAYAAESRLNRHGRRATQSAFNEAAAYAAESLEISGYNADGDFPSMKPPRMRRNLPAEQLMSHFGPVAFNEAAAYAAESHSAMHRLP